MDLYYENLNLMRLRNHTSCKVHTNTHDLQASAEMTGIPPDFKIASTATLISGQLVFT